ncbi:unnamed protein product [Mucor circinelloides]
MYDPNIFCQGCERAYSRKPHYMVLMPLKSIIKSNLASDPENPDFYCCSCCRTDQLKTKYYRMQLARLHPVKDPGGLPNGNNPNFHCASCNKTCHTRNNHTTHCKVVHSIKTPVNRTLHEELSDIYDYDATIDLDYPSSYCTQCEKH